jgi:hypothetical protein
VAESTLTLNYVELCRRVGRMLGYGWQSGSWTTEQTTDIDDVVQRGYRQFLVPPPMTELGEKHSHEWSFLRPVTTIQTTAGVGDQDLPDGFGGIADQQLTYAPTTNWPPVRIVGEGEIRAYRQSGPSNARPRRAAIRVKATSTTGATGVRWEILWAPKPDSAYTLYYPRVILADRLNAAKPYPLGGAYHAETVLASVLAIAEMEQNGEAGPRQAYWRTRLQASIAYDRQHGCPANLGYSDDKSDRAKATLNDSIVYSTVNGVLP